VTKQQGRYVLTYVEQLVDSSRALSANDAWTALATGVDSVLLDVYERAAFLGLAGGGKQ
jgi:hypothetical protein